MNVGCKLGKIHVGERPNTKPVREAELLVVRIVRDDHCHIVVKRGLIVFKLCAIDLM